VRRRFEGENDMNMCKNESGSLDKLATKLVVDVGIVVGIDCSRNWATDERTNERTWGRSKSRIGFRETCFEIKAALIGPQDFHVPDVISNYAAMITWNLLHRLFSVRLIHDGLI
jgi:hypothetical protein